MVVVQDLLYADILFGLGKTTYIYMAKIAEFKTVIMQGKENGGKCPVT